MSAAIASLEIFCGGSSRFHGISQPYVSYQYDGFNGSLTTRIIDILVGSTYIVLSPGPLNIEDERVIEQLTVQASMISVSSASTIKTLQTDI